MSGNEMVPSLMFMTFGAALIIAIGSLIWFLRKRSNRQAYKQAFDNDSTSMSADHPTKPAP